MNAVLVVTVVLFALLPLAGQELASAKSRTSRRATVPVRATSTPTAIRAEVTALPNGFPARRRDDASVHSIASDR